MRFATALLYLALAALAATAQSQKFTIDATTPEGQQLQVIGQETDEAKKLALMEDFVARHPKHEATSWVYEQLQPLYAKAGKNDKVIDAATRILAVDPDNAAVSHEALKAAEASKNPDAILTWAVRTSDICRKVAATPKPADADQVDDWKRQLDFVKQLDVYTEYAIFRAALETADPAKRIQLVETLHTRAPQSQYLPQVSGAWFLAYQQLGQKEKAVALAEEVLQRDQSNEDMLLAAADFHLGRKEYDKALLYSTKVVELMGSKPKPQGFADADWEKKKKASLGVGHWLAGMALLGQAKPVAADKELRASLPFIQDNAGLTSSALFQLGLLNFRLGDAAKGDQQRVLDAYKFFQQCAGMKSQYQAQAQKNVTVIRTKYRIR